MSIQQNVLVVLPFIGGFLGFLVPVAINNYGLGWQLAGAVSGFVVTAVIIGLAIGGGLLPYE